MPTTQPSFLETASVWFVLSEYLQAALRQTGYNLGRDHIKQSILNGFHQPHKHKRKHKHKDIKT